MRSLKSFRALTLDGQVLLQVPQHQSHVFRVSWTGLLAGLWAASAMCKFAQLPTPVVPRSRSFAPKLLYQAHCVTLVLRGSDAGTTRSRVHALLTRLCGTLGRVQGDGGQRVAGNRLHHLAPERQPSAPPGRPSAQVFAGPHAIGHCHILCPRLLRHEGGRSGAPLSIAGLSVATRAGTSLVARLRVSRSLVAVCSLGRNMWYTFCMRPTRHERVLHRRPIL